MNSVSVNVDTNKMMTCVTLTKKTINILKIYIYKTKLLPAVEFCQLDGFCYCAMLALIKRQHVSLYIYINK